MLSSAERTDAFKKLLDPSVDDAMALPEEQSKYPRKKSKELKADKPGKSGKVAKGKKRATRVVEMKETMLAENPSGDAPGGVSGKLGIGTVDKTSKPGSPKKVKAVSPKIFGEKLFVDREFTGGNPKFASLSKYGLWALYKYSGESKSEEGRELASEMEFRGLSIDRLQEECVNISDSLIDTNGEMVDKACRRRVRQLAQQQEVAESIQAGMELTGQADSPTLQGAVADLKQPSIKQETTKQETKAEVQQPEVRQEPVGPEVKQEPVEPRVGTESKEFTERIQEAMQEEHHDSIVKAENITRGSADPVVQESVVQETGTLSDDSVQESPMSPSAFETLVQAASQSEGSLENREPSDSGSLQDALKEVQETKSLKEVIDAIQTLDDYGDFIKYVKGINSWTAEKGLNLYRFMVPVEFRVWKTIGMQPPILNFLEQALERKEDASFFAEPFANVTCIYHKLVIDWCTAHGVATNKALYEFAVKRHAVYKEYNSFIADKLGDGK